MIDIESVKTYLRNTMAQSPGFGVSAAPVLVFNIETYGFQDPRLDFSMREKDGTVTVVSLVARVEQIQAPEQEPVDPRILPLWEIFNCMYPDVTTALRRLAAEQMKKNVQLDKYDLFTVAAKLEADSPEHYSTMDETWLHSVEIAYDIILHLMGEVNLDAEDLDHFLKDFGAPANWEDAGRICYLATGTRP